MSKGKNDYMYGFSNSPFDFSDKTKAVNNHLAYMFIRTQSMFKWSGLPDTIPQRVLELYIQTKGCCAIAEHDDNLYAFFGSLGGEPNEYYMPTLFTVANPYLKISKSLKIDEDCVVIPNDAMYLGLLPLCTRYATALTENELSMNIVDIMSRISSLISASDDVTAKSGQKYINDIVAGKMGIIAESGFLEGIKAQPYGNSSQQHGLTSLIEYEQYLKAGWFNELGLNANYNMKRESINSNESQLNDDMLLPLIDNMLVSREIACDKINKMFGLSLSVEFNSSWEDNAKELELEQKTIEDGETNDD